jgi:hypothetical protein
MGKIAAASAVLFELHAVKYIDPRTARMISIDSLTSWVASRIVLIWWFAIHYPGDQVGGYVTYCAPTGVVGTVTGFTSTMSFVTWVTRIVMHRGGEDVQKFALLSATANSVSQKSRRWCGVCAK